MPPAVSSATGTRGARQTLAELSVTSAVWESWARLGARVAMLWGCRILPRPHGFRPVVRPGQSLSKILDATQTVTENSLPNLVVEVVSRSTDGTRFSGTVAAN